jgi:hypothetical protein
MKLYRGLPVKTRGGDMGTAAGEVALPPANPLNPPPGPTSSRAHPPTPTPLARC